MGRKMEAGIKDHYFYTVNIQTHGTVMAYRDNYLDLDPTYRDVFGQPLLRMTFDWKENDIKMTQFVTGKAKEIAEAMGGKSIEAKMKQFGDHYDTRVYETTHNVGGAIMGEDPEQRGQPLFANLGRTQCVCNGFERLSAEYRLQPDGVGGRLGLLVRQGHSHDLSENARAAGAGLSTECST